MEDYIKSKPIEPTFEQNGLKGYRFPLVDDGLEIYFIDVTQGHDNYIVSKKITHIYYVLEGNGSFEIDGQVRDVKSGDLIEIPIGIEYVYSGQMKLILTMRPPWFEGNEETIKPNPAVR